MPDDNELSTIRADNRNQRVRAVVIAVKRDGESRCVELLILDRARSQRIKARFLLLVIRPDRILARMLLATPVPQSLPIDVLQTFTSDNPLTASGLSGAEAGLDCHTTSSNPSQPDQEGGALGGRCSSS